MRMALLCTVIALNGARGREVIRTQTRPAIEFVSGEEGLRPKFYFFEYSFLEYALADTLKYAKAPGPHCGAEGRWRRCRIAGLAFYEQAVHQMLSLCFPAQCTRRGAPSMTFLLPVWEVRLVRYAVCSVSFKVSLQTSPNTGRLQSLLGAEGPTRAGPTVAPLPLGISVDTGTLERVANWSLDRVCYR